MKLENDLNQTAAEIINLKKLANIFHKLFYSLKRILHKHNYEDL